MIYSFMRRRGMKTLPPGRQPPVLHLSSQFQLCDKHLKGAEFGLTEFSI